MNVASAELCKALYKLSGWVDPTNPAGYDLGYLLRKLPKNITHNDELFDLTIQAAGSWFASYDHKDGSGIYGHISATPEDAACQLAINLFGEGRDL